MIIQHNMESMMSNRYLGMNATNLKKSTEKLSSGYRINRASDNAAGLTISETMRAQIRGLDKASKNAQDGVSMIQTADRTAIQDEIDELLKEVDNIANNTEFNTMKLLNGNLSDQSIAASSNPLLLSHVLSDNSDNINIIYTTSDYTTQQSASGTDTLSGYDTLENTLKTEIVPQAVTSIVHVLAPAFDYLKNSSIGIGLDLYNNPSSTVLASASSRIRTDATGTFMVDYTLNINLSTLSFDASGNLDEDSRRALESTIAHEMMHTIMYESVTSGMFGYTASLTTTPAYPTWFAEGMAQSLCGGYSNDNDFVNGALGINSSTSIASIKSILNNSSNKLTANKNNSNYGTGYLACMYLGYLASGSSEISADSISSGLSTIMSQLINGSSLDAVIKDISKGTYTSTSDFASNFVNTETATFVHDLTVIVGEGNGGLASGDLTDCDLLANTPASTNLFQLNPDGTTVTNIYPSDVVVLSGGSTSSTGTAPVDDYEDYLNPSGGEVTEGNTINLSSLTSIDGIQYNSTDNTLTITKSGDYTLTGKDTTGVRIVVADNVTTNVTLDNATIKTSSGAGITIEGSSDVTLNITGTNSITSTTNNGILLSSSGSLTIKGNGTLTINGADDSTDIQNSSSSSVTIDGDGLVVKAETMNGTVNYTNGIVFTDEDYQTGTVYGTNTLSKTIDCDGATVTVSDNATLNVNTNGVIKNATKIVNKGVIENHGSIGTNVTNTNTLHNYITSYKTNITKPTAVIGNTLSSGSTSTITIKYNGGQSTTLTGNWTIRDSSNNRITDPALITVAEGDTFTYELTFQTSGGIYFNPSDSSTYDHVLATIQSDFVASQTDFAVGASSVNIDPDGQYISYTFNVSAKSANQSAAQQNGFHLQIGANKRQAMNIQIDRMTSADLGIDSISVDDYDNANDAIDACDAATTKVSSLRSKLGAYQNRLEHTIANLDNISENTQSAESRIRDLDMSEEMVRYSKSQILTQAAQSMLAQNNHAAEGILSLLQ